MPGVLVGYCTSYGCKGLPMNVDYKEIEGEATCPICYNSLNSDKVLMLIKCCHLFCLNCIGNWEPKNGCPMCRQTFKKTLTLNKPVSCSIENWEILLEEYHSCYSNIIDEFMADLNDVWKDLIGFIHKTQVHRKDYHGIVGMEHLSLKKYEDEGTLLNRGLNHAVINKGNKTINVVVGCFISHMWLRLVISPNDDIDIGQDNEYADEAVGYMNKQLEACWRVFPHLMCSDFLNHLYVRKFKNVTCYLLTSGVPDYGHDWSRHRVPMKEQLRNLKKCNFDDAFFESIRAGFPSMKVNRLSTSRYYSKSNCCESET